MTVTYEQRPYTVEAVQFNGTNSAELAALIGIPAMPEIQTDSEGVFIQYDHTGYWGPITYRINSSDWVQVGVNDNTFSVMNDATFRTNFRLSPAS